LKKAPEEHNLCRK